MRKIMLQRQKRKGCGTERAQERKEDERERGGEREKAERESVKH